MRNLCLYRRRTEPDCFVPDLALFPAPHQPRAPYIFTAGEIARLIRATSALSTAPQSPLRPYMFRLEANGSELQLALGGIGFGLVPARAVRQSPFRRDLQTFRVKGHNFRMAVWVVRGRSLDALVPVLDALEAHVVQAFPQHPDGSCTPRASRRPNAGGSRRGRQ